MQTGLSFLFLNDDVERVIWIFYLRTAGIFRSVKSWKFPYLDTTVVMNCERTFSGRRPISQPAAPYGRESSARPVTSESSDSRTALTQQDPHSVNTLPAPFGAQAIHKIVCIHKSAQICSNVVQDMSDPRLGQW